jgi:hypothetical protein
MRDASPSFDLITGRTAVGTTPVSLDPLGRILMRGILVRAPGGGDPDPNSATIYLGPKGTTIANGMPLAPGCAIEIPIKDPANLFVVSVSEGQTLAWLAI